MTKIYYKSDFDFILNLTDCDGNQIGWPKGEWEVMFWMRGNKARIYRAGVGSDGQPYGCYNDNDRIHIVMDSHGLGIGQLMCEVRLNRSNSHYPDGVKSHVFAADLDIEQLTQAADVAVQERMFTDKVYLSATDSPASWREIPAAEAEALQAQQQELAEKARAEEEQEREEEPS